MDRGKGDLRIRYKGRWLELELAEDPNSGYLIWSNDVLDPIQSSFNLGDASYANFIPKVGGVYAQSDLSDGAGKFLQELSSHPEYKRYKYADGIDASQPGYLQMGPEMASLAVPADSGPLESMFVLAGMPYLVLGRKVVKYEAGALTEVHDFGVGKSGYGSAVFYQLQAEAADQSSTGAGASDKIDGPEKWLAQSFTPSASRFLSRIDLQLSRTDVTAVQTVTINGSPTGGTFTLTYGAASTGALAYNADAATVQAALRTLPELGAVTVAKTNWTYQVTFTGIIAAALALVADATALTGGASPSITVATTRAGFTIGSLIELAIQSDVDGHPSGADLVTITMQPRAIPATAGTVSFRLENNHSVLQEKGGKLWAVLRAPGALPSAYVSWTRGAASSYAGGTGSASSDNGESWTDNANDYYFTTYAKGFIARAFIGRDAGDKMTTTTDGTTFSDATVEGKHVAAYEDLLVRDLRVDALGAIVYSQDGRNWSEPILIDQPAVPITAIIPIAQMVIVVKEDGIYAVNLDETPPRVDCLYTGPREATNGRGSCVWKGGAYIPFAGRLMLVAGDLTNGLVVNRSIGPEGQREWTSPWGSSRIVAVASDRHYLWALMETEGSYKLWKSMDPVNLKWHGSIADLGTPAAVHAMAVYDPAGIGNPLLFCSTTSYALAKIVLSRTANPAADPNYRYNATAEGKLYLCRAHANFHVHPKAWMSESITFLAEVSGGYVEMAYDLVDGNGYQALGRLYRTGALLYRDELLSRVVDRQLVMKTATNTVSPIVMSTGLESAVRASARLRSLKFTVKAETGLSSDHLADRMLLRSEDISAALQDMMGLGVRQLIDPDGRLHSVLLIDVQEVLIEKGERSNRKLISVEAVSRC